MIGYFMSFSEQLGVPIAVLIFVLLWEVVWKLLALWKAARNKHVTWFIVLTIFNTIGILSILYIYVFADMMGKKKKNKKKPRRKKKK